MKIAIIGYGVEGKALLQYLMPHGHDVTVCDVKPSDEFPTKNSRLHFRTGPAYLKDLQEFDLIFRSPGVPYLKPEFNGVRGQLTSVTRYFFEHCPCPIVGVTGTKGKGTVSSLIYEMLKASGQKVYLGGNIGQPPITFLDQLAPEDTVVLELSSFQLQDLDRSPHVAVVLGMTPDHLDHHRDMEEYIEAKRNIVRFQGPKDVAILDVDNEISAKFSVGAQAKILEISMEKSVKDGAFLKVGSFIVKHGSTGLFVGEKNATQLRGEHNIKNILAAAAAANVCGARVEAISAVIREWKGLPHRLELVAEVNGAVYYNDSASTNPDTAIAAIRAFSAPIILIAGGSDKNIDFAILGEEIAKRLNVKTVILMGETKGKIEHAIDEAVAAEELRIQKTGARSHGLLRRRNIPLELITAESYQEAFMVAKILATPGDIVLLSPACASFDMFSNYRERGEIFRNFVIDNLGNQT